MTHPLIDTAYQLDYRYSKHSGRVFMSGTQALVRLPLMQRMLDIERGWNTAGFVSGYRGSPLGGYDQALWKAKVHLEAKVIRFLPAINEELAATAVLGTQQVESDPHRKVDGVFALWYGKGPGVDRAGDALKHGNAYGSSPRGGVLVVAGDDHGCVSSSMPHQSDITMQAWSMPIVNPANLEEYLEFGLYGWALSRFSGTWVGFKAISETVESSSTVNLDVIPTQFSAPQDFIFPQAGVHYRWPDLPSLLIEERLAIKLNAVRAFARTSSIDKTIISSPQADLGIVTCGKAHLDLLETLRRLGLSLDELSQAGVRLYKVGLSFPIETTRILEFARGLKEILVIEEKAPIIERQLKELFYNRQACPNIIGKTDALGGSLLPALGELRPSRVMPVFAEWLAKHKANLDRRALVIDFTAPKLLSNEADAVRRLPYYCSGCPHNISTKIPKGSYAQAGIGCHFMASWMVDRKTTGLIQMGGEGVDWAAHSMFTATPHVFQNLGDGTYYHSGYLAIRQAIAAGANMTYKILFNDAVAMTGGQPIDGTITVDAIARQVEAEGAKRVVVVSDQIDKFDADRDRFPQGTRFHDRADLDQVQRELREIPGVTVLIYEQTCAAEKRRRRKKGEYPDPPRRLFINTAVCEGCGDCGKQSNCLSIVPIDTDFGRKRMIEQSSCNKDYSCVNGFCPSFVSVLGGSLRKAIGATFDQNKLNAAIKDLPAPPPHQWSAPYDLLVIGVGGTGIVTVGALITMAAHLEGKYASVLDFMGFAQKGGAVLSNVRLAAQREALNQVRIDTQQADALLVCDLVVGASNDALQTVRHGRTQIIVNTHEIPTAAFVHNPNASLHVSALLEKMRFAAGTDRVALCDGQALAQRYLGDSQSVNVLMMGFAWQRGLVPVSLAAMERAIELNGVAIAMNKTAFALGRLAAANPQALDELEATKVELKNNSELNELDALIARRADFLTQYQNADYAARYRDLVERVRTRESSIVDHPATLKLTTAVARYYAKLMAYKDEYEVARLYTNGDFARQLSEQFSGDFKLQFHMAPPFLHTLGKWFHKRHQQTLPKKVVLGGWIWMVMRVLAKAKILRGSLFDLFGYSAERKLERRLILEYQQLISAWLPKLTRENLALLTALAEIPEQIRGYGHVKLAHITDAKVKEQELLAQLEGRGEVKLRPRTEPIKIAIKIDH